MESRETESNSVGLVKIKDEHDLMDTVTTISTTEPTGQPEVLEKATLTVKMENPDETQLSNDVINETSKSTVEADKEMPDHHENINDKRMETFHGTEKVMLVEFDLANSGSGPKQGNNSSLNIIYEKNLSYDDKTVMSYFNKKASEPTVAELSTARSYRAEAESTSSSSTLPSTSHGPQGDPSGSAERDAILGLMLLQLEEPSTSRNNNIPRRNEDVTEHNSDTGTDDSDVKKSVGGHEVKVKEENGKPLTADKGVQVKTTQRKATKVDKATQTDRTLFMRQVACRRRLEF